MDCGVVHNELDNEYISLNLEVEEVDEDDDASSIDDGFADNDKSKEEVVIKKEFETVDIEYCNVGFNKYGIDCTQVKKEIKSEIIDEMGYRIQVNNIVPEFVCPKIKLEQESVDFGVDVIVEQSSSTGNTVKITHLSGNNAESSGTKSKKRKLEESLSAAENNDGDSIDKITLIMEDNEEHFSNSSQPSNRDDHNVNSENGKENGFHLCEICGTPFDNQIQLKNHQKFNHTINQDVTCNKCFVLVDDLQSHQIGSALCQDCGKDLQFPCLLKQHECTSTPSSSQYFKIHSLTTCDVCDYLFKNTDDLEKHRERIREMEGIPRCPLCFKFFSDMKEAHLHQTGSGYCIKCGKDYELPCVLVQHSCLPGCLPSIATRATPGVISMVKMVCDICRTIFHNQSDYLNHIQIVHEINPNELECKECNMIFRKIAELKVHEETLHNNKIHRCYMCLRKFVAKHLLYVHQQGSGFCIVCEEDLKMPCALIRHVCKLDVEKQLERLQRDNTSETTDKNKAEFCMIRCNFCKREFPHHAVYLAHVRLEHLINTDELMCNVCGYVYSNASRLKAHIQLVHNMQGVLRCPKCNKAFRSRLDMLTHIDLNENCQKCGKTFRLSCMFEKHIC